MPKPQIVSRNDLQRAMADIEEMTGEVPTNRQIADLLTERLSRGAPDKRIVVTERLVNRTKMREGLTNPYPRHGKAVPWTLRPEDQSSTEAKYLRVLSALAQEEPRPIERFRPAANWARSIVKEGNDVRYDADAPAGERWIIFPADPEGWHLKTVLDGAKAGLARLVRDQPAT